MLFANATNSGPSWTWTISVTEAKQISVVVSKMKCSY